MKFCKTTGLPMGQAPKTLDFPHFPTRQQVFIWRNWGIVPVEKLASILSTNSRKIEKMASDMGLPRVIVTDARWLTNGYMTIIRANWHLLPYGQLLVLLDWSRNKMESALKEDDFLWNKLGHLKPDVSPLQYRELTPKEQHVTKELRNTVKKYFKDNDFEFQPFKFIFSRANSLDAISSSRFDTAMIYSYNGIYGDPLADSDLSSYPDELLKNYASFGINAIWIHVVLYQLVESPSKELSDGWQNRIENLRKLVVRCNKYNIKVILYLNEPRTIPEKYARDFADMTSLYHAHSNSFGLCTSNTKTQQHLKDSCSKVFKEVPGLGGVMTISMSENATNCVSHLRHHECPACAVHAPEKIIADVNRIIAEGVHEAAPDARVIVNTWAWRDEWSEKAVKLLPDTVELMCVSEWGLATECRGIKGSVADYSISHPGPSEKTRKIWRIAQERNMKTWAKIQINNSWECSAVPYIPVLNLLEQHLNNLEKCEIRNLMLSWSLGGSPSPNLDLLNSSPQEMAEREYGEHAEIVLEAWKLFSDAFSKFPLSGTATIYNGPQNAGPANLFYLKPTGYNATMVGYAYDDLERWCSIFPVEVFEKAFEKMCLLWAQGLKSLNKIEYGELNNIATAMYCHLKSTYNQIIFVRNRLNLDKAYVRNKLIKLMDDEIKLTRTLILLQQKDPRIGYEASNHYYYTPNLLAEKILNCEYIKTEIWAKTEKILCVNSE